MLASLQAQELRGHVMAESSVPQLGQLDARGQANVLAEYRQPRQYRRPFLARFVAFGAIAGLLSWAGTRGIAPDLLVIGSVLGLAAAYNGAMYIWRGRFRTRLTTEGIEIRGYFNHFVPWRDVRAVQEGGFGSAQLLNTDYEAQPTYARGLTSWRAHSRTGSTTGPRAKLGVVRVVRFKGKSLMLRAPLVTSWAPDPYFDQKLRQIEGLSGQYGTRPVDR